MKLFLLAFFSLSVLPFAEANQRTGMQTHFTAYSGNHKCDPGTGGGNQAARGKAKPLDHTWENPGDGWVMVAVDPELFDDFYNCTGHVKGKTIKVRDICEACRGEGLHHVDVSHSCRGENFSGEIEWEFGCPGVQRGNFPESNR